MEILIVRENAFALFRNLNKAVLSVYISLKTQYESSPPPSAEITNTLKTWKTPLEETITSQILNITKDHQLPQGYSQALIISKIFDNYKEQQQFIELYKNLNSSIQTIKDFIRTNAIKDTSKQSNST